MGKTITRTSKTVSTHARSLRTFKRSKLKKMGTYQLVIGPWVEDSLGLQERACIASAVHGAI